MLVSWGTQKSRPAYLPGNGSVLASSRSAQNQGQMSWSASFLSPVDLRLEIKCEETASRDRPRNAQEEAFAENDWVQTLGPKSGFPPPSPRVSPPT